MTSLKEFSLAAARSYLQSAVFVDDHIYDKQSGMPMEPIAVPSRKPIFVPERAEVPVNNESQGPPPPLDVQPYHPKDLVSSFAREGIICALYEPPEGFQTDHNSEIFKLCERPDIIILDWDFSGDSGAKALDLIAGLVKQSHQALPHHTRLLSVYTTDPSLVAVANKIGDRLRADGFEHMPEGSQCRLRSGATRLVVLGKDIARFGTDEESFTVKESDLANRLIEEFAGMNLGIFPSYALHGLAAIRRNSKRVLDKFHGGVDGAFLLHRKMVIDSEEAFDQLPELLGDELRTIVEDEHLSPELIQGIVTSALAGNDISNEDKVLINSSEKPKKIAPKLLTGTPKAAPKGHLELAMLFGSRTQYSSASRVLGYGTIVRHRVGPENSWSYAFCAIPICDSLRLEPGKKVRYPFWSLAENVYDAVPSRRGMILQLADGTIIGLTAGGKASDMLWIEEFDVDASTKTVVAPSIGGVFKYVGSAQEVEWVGQLKSLHAQRIAHDIAQGLSRVGLLEAEWLRLLCS